VRAWVLLVLLANVTATGAQELTRASAPPSYFSEHERRVERATIVYQRDHTLDELRDRDRLELYGVQPGRGRAATLGAAMFGGMVVMSAHAPPPLRPLFDARLHLGPALFDGGGLGAAAGGRF
jgi:hypothetical protein